MWITQEGTAIYNSFDKVRKAGFATDAKIEVLLGLITWFEAEKNRGRPNFPDTVSNMSKCFLNGIVKVEARVNENMKLTDPAFSCSKSCSNCPLAKLT